ncbi:WD repeat-containing protein 54 [Neoarius graeffei]|uniref:WD repeat-containing protein 54 n=1 Tax=Neoarius graeffei TaxID=443677 RepID=UPI00298D26E9|nr:WD repeat-containing protein 54 [Neoarius graeffei]XP_060763152.1 WD repeat-containing protein 54 [Neoarius graeffei]XP_060763153.1 WD repeat-containing protein 54 [Neoarius graeffei]XP_060763154.1 WD repeat-containing protein 54 [Neoarius graeffei]
MAQMFHREKSIQLKSSASALYNNLSVLRLAPRSLTHFAVVHVNVVNLVSASWDGLNYSHRQLQSKEGSVATNSSLIIQAAWCVLPSRDLLVVTSQKGIQMYESDGSIMVYWHALDIPETSTDKAVFARGIAAVRDKYICVGVYSGAVLVFDVPSKGSNITLSEVLEEHTDSVTDMASECSGSTEYTADLVSADDSGLLCVWKSGGDFQLLNKIPGFDMSCSSVKLWKGTVIAAYGTGQIRLYEGITGILHAEVNAHARWIYSLDIAPFPGLLLSAAEDSFVRVWHLSPALENNTVEIEHLYNECVTDTQICGAKFCDGDGHAFAVTGYDLSEIIRYTQA